MAVILFWFVQVRIIISGRIENAEIAIQTIKMSPDPPPADPTPDYTYTGGIVLAEDAVFRNNEIAVIFWPYNQYPSVSYFRECTFETNSNLLPDAVPDKFIEMNDIINVRVFGSTFTDERTGISADRLTSGIKAYDGRFYVQAQRGLSSVFTNLYEGIRTIAHNPERTVNVENSQFHKNLRSLYISSIYEAYVVGNEFTPWDDDVPGEEESYCMYLDYCTDYTVEENDFNFGGLKPTGTGLVINNSGPDNNELYNNGFTNLEYATLAQNNNRGANPNVGLKIKCNDYWQNYQDIAVTAVEETEYPGIARNQGAEGGTDMQAGNRFSLNENGSEVSDYSTFKQGPINYFHHKPDLEPRVKPIYLFK